MSTTIVTERGPRTLRIVFGVLCLLLGLAVLIWPGTTLLVVAVLIGIELILAGIARLLLASRVRDAPGWIKPMMIVSGVLALLAGIFCLFLPGASLIALAWFIAAGWLFDGIAELISAAAPGVAGVQRTWLIVFGVLSIIAAIIMLVLPGTSLVVLAQLAGAVLIALGIVTLLGVLVTSRSTRSA